MRADLFRLAVVGLVVLFLLAVSNDWLGARGVFDNVTGAIARWLVDGLPDGSPPAPNPAPAPAG